MTQRRRRRAPAPRSIFRNTATRIRQEGGAGRQAIIRDNLQSVENTIRRRPGPRPPIPSVTIVRRGRRETLPPSKFRFRRWTRDVKTPNSPRFDVPFDEKLNEQTEKVLSDVKNKFSNIDHQLKNGLKQWLMKNKINPLKERSTALATEKKLGPKDYWTDEELSNLHREIEILEFEANKHENNSFLNCFDIDNLPGNYIRSLNLLNDVLLSSKSATHIGNGMIFICKDGVRIILDSRRTTNSYLNGKAQVHAFVGPENDWVCLQSEHSNCPGPDLVCTMIKISDSGWPDIVMEALEGEGEFSINYQLNKWESKQYHSVKMITHQHYKKLSTLIHSIEVYSLQRLIIIGTLDEKETGQLIGKGGQRISELRESIISQIGGGWAIHVQKLQ